MIARVERELIEEALKWARGNLSAAGRRLGTTERIMGLRVRRYGHRSRSVQVLNPNGSLHLGRPQISTMR